VFGQPEERGVPFDRTVQIAQSAFGVPMHTRAVSAMIFAAASCGACGSASASTAPEEVLYCRVVSIVEVAPDGTLAPLDRGLRQQIGSTFEVVPKTGEIRGSYFVNNRHSETVTVRGWSSGSDLYVISESGPPVSVTYVLRVAGTPWKGGQRQFAYLFDGRWLYSGTCS
jgi:hypothetical protein